MKSAASEIDTLDILRTKLAAAEAKESAKRQKKQARKSSGKDCAKANSKAVNELGSGEDLENRDLALADDDVASGRRTILVKYTVLSSGLCCSSWQPTYLFNSWSDPSQFHLTDTLLTKMEDSETFHQAFGFVRSGNANASQGKKAYEHYASLAAKVFRDHDSPNEWRGTDIKELRTVVKNRVTKYISLYSGLLYLHGVCLA